MCMYIGIEDLAANALIRILSQGHNNNTFVSFAKLYKYGLAVVEKLNSKNEEAILIYSPESTCMLFTDYSDFFERYTDDQGYEGIRLIEGRDEKDLIKRFIGQIPVVVQNVLGDNAMLSRFFERAA